MTRWGIGALVAIALVAGLALRLARLDARPMHHDEANQAVKFGALLERGEYRYDARDHHGPTLYYLSLPAAWARGQHTLASLDERTLRGVTALFGAATILLLPLLSDAIGRTAVVAAAALLAVSPAMVFYSRFFIQETLFAFFTLAFLIAVGRVATGAGRSWYVGAGIAAGLAAATKETSVIVLPAALLAAAIAWWSLGPDRPQDRLTHGAWRSAAVLSLSSAVIVAAVFYSSFFSYPGGILEPFRAATTYIDRGIDPASHVHPWHYYLGILTWSSSGGLRWTEALILGLAVIGAASALRRPGRTSPQRIFWTRHLASFVVITAAIFSAIPYKTPWNLLPFHAGAIALAGIGFSTLMHATSSRIVRGTLAAALVAGSGHLGLQAWRASVTYAADERNPYAYVQTLPDAVRMATRIRDLAALHPDGERMLVSVVAPAYEQWPIPWYLRAMPYVGYWTSPADALPLQAPVVVASLEHTETLDRALGDRYVSEFYGLRPNVLLALYIERGLWDRYLATGAGAPSTSACVPSSHGGPDPCVSAPARLAPLTSRAGFMARTPAHHRGPVGRTS